MKCFLTLIFIGILYKGQAQSVARYADASVGFGSSKTNVSFSYQHNWKVGKSKKLQLGIGGRFTSFFGSNQYYVTAPAGIVKGSTGPGALFDENIVANMDSVLLPSHQVNTLNMMLTIGYELSSHFRVGFNIDAIGFSFGGAQAGTYINGLSVAPTTVKPAGFNLLLVGENDFGSLNSELYVNYFFDDTWAVKLGVQHHFIEYVSDTKVQQFPEPNDRFRITPTVLSVGATYRLH